MLYDWRICWSNISHFLHVVCSMYMEKNTMYLVGMEGHATLQMSALPYFAGIAFFKL